MNTKATLIGTELCGNFRKFQETATLSLKTELLTKNKGKNKKHSIIKSKVKDTDVYRRPCQKFVMEFFLCN